MRSGDGGLNRLLTSPQGSSLGVLISLIGQRQGRGREPGQLGLRQPWRHWSGFAAVLGLGLRYD